MVRMYVAAANRLAELPGAERAEMGPSYIVPAALLSIVFLVGTYVLRGPFHWLVSVAGR